MPRNDGSTTTSERGITKRAGTTGTSYRVRVSAIDARTGQRRVVQGSFPTFKAARDFKRKTAHELASGSYQPPSEETLAELLDHWLASSRHKPKTREVYAGVIRRLINPALGDVTLGHLTARQLQTFYNGITSAQYAKQVHAVLKSALALAVRDELIGRNLTDGLVTGSGVVPSTRPALVVWTKAELARFLDAAHDDCRYPLFVVASRTGMRVSELINLRWADISFDLARLFVTESKTKAGQRRISLDAETVQFLRAHQAEQERRRELLGPAWTDEDRVFERGDGTPHSVKQVEHAMDSILGRVEPPLPRLTPHGLRHLHAATLAQAGVPLTEIQQRLGHVSFLTTANVYIHFTVDDERAVANRIPAIFPAVHDGPDANQSVQTRSTESTEDAKSAS